MIEFVVGTAADDGTIADVRRLLRAVDKEFVPPLSDRTDSISLDTRAGRGTVDSYLAAIAAEEWILVRRGRSVVGLLSHLESHVDRRLSPDHPVVYVTTVAVDAGHRRAGLAVSMYNALMDRARDDGKHAIATRTWSSNLSHLELLSRLGFDESFRLVDDRCVGEDTVYLMLPISPRIGAAV